MEWYFSCIISHYFLVSLFHYRNYGGDIGKVMVGIQVPPETEYEFQEFLSSLKYPYTEDSSNEVYQRFLK